MAEMKGKPPQDELDFLLANDGETTADMASWKTFPETQQAAKVLRSRYQSMVKQLIAVAATSTDGRVASLGGKLSELGAVVISMGGKA